LREKIFELYFTTKKGGSGIGLAQTYQAMQWHYGSIDFETVEGQGTTFRLRLPVTEIRSEADGGNGRVIASSLTIPNS
jgi:signal transduction histidine kinase